MADEKEIYELKMLSAFLRERLVAVPSKGKELVEFLVTIKAELESIEVVSESAKLLVDGYIALADAELRTIRNRERLRIACIMLAVTVLFFMALGLHPDHSLAEALGR